MNLILKRIIDLFNKKKIDETKFDTLNIKVNKEDVSYFSLSSNTIISFKYRGNLYYFRECPQRLSKKEYLLKAIDNFFTTLDNLGISEEHFSQEIPINLDFSDTEIIEFRAYVNNKIKSKEFIETNFNVYKISENINFSIWDNQKYDLDFFSAFGFNDLPESLFDIAVYFLWNIRSASSSLRTLNTVIGKRHSCFGAVRSISTCIIANSLNISDIVTETKWCNLTIDGEKTLFGVLSWSASGNRMADCKVTVSPQLQRELNILNVLDTVCMQPDHGPNNYNVTADGKVCAFDNDNPTTFIPLPFTFISLAGCSPLTDKRNNILRPYFDYELYNSLKNLDKKKLKSELKPYLNTFQTKALIIRLNNIINAVDKEILKNNSFLLSEKKWNNETVKEELSGKYGITYLVKANNL